MFTIKQGIQVDHSVPECNCNCNLCCNNVLCQ